MMSSIKVVIVLWLIMSQKRLFIIVWNVAEELVRPKYITISSYAPICVIKAVFYSFPSLILTLL